MSSLLRRSMERRYQRLAELDESPDARAIELEMCRRSVLHFFDYWVWTYDPRSATTGAPHVPMDLWPKQREFLKWLEAREKNEEDGACEKSRDVGFTWLCGGFAVHRWLFVDGFKTTFGSRKSEYVDKLGDPDSIFEKIRMLIGLLPPWMMPGAEEDDKQMLIRNVKNGNTIRGEAGDNMGRGGRSTLYFLDEAAFLEHPDMVEKSTRGNSNVRIYGSSANGTANLFYRKMHGGLDKRQTFRLHYTDDPRMTPERVAVLKRDTEPHVFASEYEINYAASVEGVVIPSTWVEAAIGALKKLGIAEATGQRGIALDVADEGMDLNAAVGGCGIEISIVEQWSGKNEDIFSTVERAFAICDREDYHSCKFDSDGLGAGVRGDARVINEARKKRGQSQIIFEPFRGSESVLNPEHQDVKGRKNIDYFANRKAQAWWSVRRRFQDTFRAVVEKDTAISMDKIISINPSCGNLVKLTSELSQPTFSVNTAGKLLIDKAPDGARSPNLADALMIRMSGFSVVSLGVSNEVLKAANMRMVRGLGRFRGRRR